MCFFPTSSTPEAFDLGLDASVGRSTEGSSQWLEMIKRMCLYIKKHIWRYDPIQLFNGNFCSKYVMAIGFEYDLNPVIVRASYVVVAVLASYDNCSKGVADLISSLGMRHASNF